MEEKSDNNITGYALSRAWFDFAFENPEKIKPNHSALYFFCIEHCNRLGWKEKFGLPTTMAMEAIGIKSYNTYKQTLSNLVEWGFVKMIETSKNQYSANIIALSNFNKALDKALNKALTKHTSKQSESTVQSTVQSIDSIDKPLTINNKPINNKLKGDVKHPSTPKKNKSLEDFKEIAKISFENNNCLFENDFKKEWLKLLQTAKWKKKEQSAIDASLKLLMKYDETFAQSLVEKAIAGSYQGVVFADTDNHFEKFKNQTNGTNSNQSASSKKESRDRMANLARQILAAT